MLLSFPTLRPILVVLALAVGCTAVAARPAAAQDPRLGIGFNAMLSTEEASVLGLGFRGRVSFPYNQDLSFAVGTGVSGFVLGGQDDASYVVDPQASAIITLPGAGEQAPYFLGGFGAYLSSEGSSGPTLHFGIGRVQQLSETTIFYELDPALIIGQERVGVAVPARLGIIF